MKFNSVKIKNMSKKQLRSEINIGDAMIFTLAKENDLLREAITELEEDVCILDVSTYKSLLDAAANTVRPSDELSDDPDLWQSCHSDTVGILDDVARDLLAMAAAVGVLAKTHADLHG